MTRRLEDASVRRDSKGHDARSRATLPPNGDRRAPTAASARMEADATTRENACVLMDSLENSASENAKMENSENPANSNVTARMELLVTTKMENASVLRDSKEPSVRRNACQAPGASVAPPNVTVSTNRSATQKTGIAYVSDGPARIARKDVPEGGTVRSAPTLARAQESSLKTRTRPATRSMEPVSARKGTKETLARIDSVSRTCTVQTVPSSARVLWRTR